MEHDRTLSVASNRCLFADLYNDWDEHNLELHQFGQHECIFRDHFILFHGRLLEALSMVTYWACQMNTGRVGPFFFIL